jgi:hypothetical protein
MVMVVVDILLIKIHLMWIEKMDKIGFLEVSIKTLVPSISFSLADRI